MPPKLGLREMRGAAVTRLRELDLQFVAHRAGPPEEIEIVQPSCVADGVMFLCPKCYVTNGGPVGTHSVICWFANRVADDVEPKPGRWTPSGTGVDDLSLTPSVQLLSDCCWHGYLTNGEAQTS